MAMVPSPLNSNAQLTRESFVSKVRLERLDGEPFETNAPPIDLLPVAEWETIKTVGQFEQIFLEVKGVEFRID